MRFWNSLLSNEWIISLKSFTNSKPLKLRITFNKQNFSACAQILQIYLNIFKSIFRIKNRHYLLRPLHECAWDHTICRDLFTLFSTRDCINCRTLTSNAFLTSMASLPLAIHKEKIPSKRSTEEKKKRKDFMWWRKPDFLSNKLPVVLFL